jgi:glucosamine-6-phosphate isomerase
MKIKTYPDYPTLSREAANLVARHIVGKPGAVVCLASGSTPVQVFRFLVEDVKAGRLNIDGCTFVGLDEWVGIDISNEGSCRNMMDRDFFHPLQIKESKIKFFDGMAENLNQECDRINQFIASRGGLDIMLVGIGLNGHIAMNEPGTSFDLYSQVIELSEVTKVVGQKYFQKKTNLSKGLTLGLRHFRESKLPILMANGQKKASIVQKALTLPPTTEIPASVIQKIPHALVLLDEEAAGLLPNPP